ncbi:hypothetical protein BJV77DRAFT_1016147 [Russula vinacea]|nr:hypothetical protein BJV77DRAFT_1016147 [Russula vinacea]
MKPSFAYFICFSPRGFATISLDQVAMPRPPRDAQLPNLVAVSSPQLYPGATHSVLCGMNSSHSDSELSCRLKQNLADTHLNLSSPCSADDSFLCIWSLASTRTGVSVCPMTNVGKCENISGSSWKGSISLGSLCRLSQPICQNVGGVSRWASERRAFPVFSLPFASLDPFVSNISAGRTDRVHICTPARLSIRFAQHRAVPCFAIHPSDAKQQTEPL